MTLSKTNSERSATAEPRREYRFGALSEKDVSADPLQQFTRWFDEAARAQVLDYSAMALATSSGDGPSVRTVLLKGLDPRGLRWFTDKGSEKGQALRANPRAELLFHWRELDRQVRVRGTVTELSDDESDAYFYSRPLGSQLAAATSAQSRAVASREELEARYRTLSETHSESVPRPQDWGGFLLQPDQYEFWQGRESRLHDRLQYQVVEGGWVIQRLQP
ncbi:MAG: pyridoxamine 5'-phosphate oxidase [Pseudomonadota bacterium]|nr:pyridoxamine 5'-phosphate oxidase [Pseudomonadota bacterium]